MRKLVISAIFFGGLLVFAENIMAQNCNPNADQIAVYQFPLYKGNCSVLEAGLYPNVHQEILKDLVRSIIVGQNVKALVCDAPNYDGACEEFERSGNVELKNPKYNPEGSGISLKVVRRPNAPANGDSSGKKGVIIYDAKTKMIIGGYMGGRFVDAKTAAADFKMRSNYRFYGVGVVEGESSGTAEFMVYSEQCQSNTISFFGATGPIGLGPRVTWEPTPTTPEMMDSNDRAVTAVAREYLRSKGIANPVIEIKQALRVDLDGDGLDETIISARHIDAREDMSQLIGKGSYSFLIIRKMVAGKMTNIVIGSEVFTRDTKMEQQSPKDYEVTAVLDLDADGTMEIVVYTREYESAYSQVFKVKDGKAIEVLSAGCGA